MCSTAVICYFCYFQPVAQLSDWIVEMQSWADTNSEHLLPDQPDEHLDAKGTLYCHILCAAFVKEQFFHRRENCRILLLEQGFVVLRAVGKLRFCSGGSSSVPPSRAEIVPVLVVPNSASDTEGPRAVGIPWSFPACRTRLSRWSFPWMGTQQLGTSALWPSHGK